MLLNNFYKFDIKEVNKEKITAVVKINKEHDIFKGHFPDFPLVPGVCQVLMVKEIFNSGLKKNLHIKTAKSIKFLSMIDPAKHENIEVKITYSKEAENNYKIKALLFSENNKFLKIIGGFGDK